MIANIGIYTYQYELLVSFIIHLIIFIGTGYVALCNTKLPRWHVTPLWYVGLTSLTVCATILLQWMYGADFPLSHWNIGQWCELAVSIAIAAIAAIMFTGTLRRNIINKHKNNKEAPR